MLIKKDQKKIDYGIILSINAMLGSYRYIEDWLYWNSISEHSRKIKSINYTLFYKPYRIIIILFIYPIHHAFMQTIVASTESFQWLLRTVHPYGFCDESKMGLINDQSIDFKVENPSDANTTLIG